MLFLKCASITFVRASLCFLYGKQVCGYMTNYIYEDFQAIVLDIPWWQVCCQAQ